MEYTEHIINEVNKVVSPAYLVGGSVRDMILGKTPDDFDFTTPLEPDDVEKKIKDAGWHVYAIGKKFGTLGFKVIDINGKIQKVEVTTFRSEKYQPGSRWPSVEYVSELRTDLSRRDFTINAIAYDGEFIDPFGGRIHAQAKQIKAVGKATDRFKEDPLRMLRAARFAAQLGFEVDPNMIGFIRKMSSQITTISRERWVQEMDKLLKTSNPSVGLDILQKTKLLKFMLPELNLTFTVPGMADRVTSRLSNEPDNDADIRWALLLLDIGVGMVATPDIMDENYTTFPHEELIGLEMARGIALRLRFSKDRMNTIEDAFKNKNGWERKYAEKKVSVQPDTETKVL